MYFSPLAEITVDIPETLPLSIFTAGLEVDGCGREPLRQQLNPDSMESILKQPEEKWEPTIQFYADRYSAIPFENSPSPFCVYNPSDRLGNIIQFYKPVGYGAGAHEEFANNADYILRYTITVVPPPNLDQKKDCSVLVIIFH